MKYFFRGFFAIIILVLAFESQAAQTHLWFDYNSHSGASNACFSKQQSIGGNNCVSVSCTSGPSCKYWYTYAGPYADATFYKYLASEDRCEALGMAIDPVTNACIADVPDPDPDPVCPASGTAFEGSTAVSSDSNSLATIGEQQSINGCTIAVTYRTVDCWGSPAGSADCRALSTYKYTGEKSPDGEPDLLEDTVNPQLAKPTTTPLSFGDHTKSTSDIINTPPNVISLPDASTVEVETSVKTEVSGKGVTIGKDSTGIKVKSSDGINKTSTTTTTTTTNADGSKTVSKDIHTTYNQTDDSIIKITSDTGQATYTESGGFSGSNDTNNTKTYDDNGTVTGETDTASTTGETEPSEETEEKGEVSGGGNCASPPVCSGDAIGCALLNQQFKTACLEADDEVSNTTDCDTAFSCSGSVFECEALRLKNHSFCEFTADKATAFVNSTEFKSHFDPATDLDENGVLTSLSPTEVDLYADSAVGSSISELYNIVGKSGACPEDRIIPFLSKTVPYSFGPVCNMAELSAPFFIIFAILRRSRALLKVITDK